MEVPSPLTTSANHRVGASEAHIVQGPEEESVDLRDDDLLPPPLLPDFPPPIPQPTVSLTVIGSGKIVSTVVSPAGGRRIRPTGPGFENAETSHQTVQQGGEQGQQIFAPASATSQLTIPVAEIVDETDEKPPPSSRNNSKRYLVVAGIAVLAAVVGAVTGAFVRPNHQPSRPAPLPPTPSTDEEPNRDRPTPEPLSGPDDLPEAPLPETSKNPTATPSAPTMAPFFDVEVQETSGAAILPWTTSTYAELYGQLASSCTGRPITTNNTLHGTTDNGLVTARISALSCSSYSFTLLSYDSDGMVMPRELNVCERLGDNSPSAASAAAGDDTYCIKVMYAEVPGTDESAATGCEANVLPAGSGVSFACAECSVCAMSSLRSESIGVRANCKDLASISGAASSIEGDACVKLFPGPAAEDEASLVPTSVKPTSAQPTVMPTLPPSSRPPTRRPTTRPTERPVKCFDSGAELQDAVDAYVADPVAKNRVSRIYGHPIGIWCVSKVSNFSYLFSVERNAALASFNMDISGWDVRNAVTMRRMFAGDYTRAGDLQSQFNGDLSKWVVSRVEDMRLMFANTAKFNQRLPWDVSAVLDMAGMFLNAAKFNSDSISAWNVGSVTEMRSMFSANLPSDQIERKLSSSNKPLAAWDVSSVRDMTDMFSNSVFNQPLNRWFTANAENMNSMFAGSDFNQPLDLWDVSTAKDLQNMFLNARLFNQDLCSWGEHLIGREANLRGMFLNTTCFHERTPDMATAPPGPFCARCT